MKGCAGTMEVGLPEVEMFAHYLGLSMEDTHISEMLLKIRDSGVVSTEEWKLLSRLVMLGYKSGANNCKQV